MSSRFETFAYLPPLSPAQAQSQADAMLAAGYVPLIEFAENPQLGDVYWQLWPIVTPRSQDRRFHKEELNASLLMMQVNTCGQRHPYAMIRLSGYNPKTKQTAMAFIVKTPDAA